MREFAKHKRYSSNGMGVMNNFNTYTLISKPKRRFLGQGKGHLGSNSGILGKVLSQGMCMPNIKGVPKWV